jgi:lipoate-protein ligase A
MRLPRQDTSLSLPAEDPRAALLRDEALLDQLTPGHSPLGRDAALTGPSPLVHWWVPASAAITIGLGQRHRIASIVDLERCRAAGIDVLERRAGGGALLLDEHMICGAVCLPLPDPRAAEDVTESYRWLGALLAGRLRALGIAQARAVEVAEARADVAALKSDDSPASRLVLATCYGALSPHEVAVGSAKLVGIAQVRRRHAALFQFGILLRDQSPLADYLVVPDEPTREQIREALRQRTIGLESLRGALSLREGEAIQLRIAEPDQFL